MKENRQSARDKSTIMKRVGLIVVFTMSVLSFVVYYCVGSANITTEAAASVAMSIAGLLLVAILFALTMSDQRQISRSDGYFLLALLLLSNCLFFGELGWIVEGNKDFIWANYLLDCITQLCSASMVVAFWEYLLNTILETKREALRPLTMVIRILICIRTIIVLLNPFTGLIFTVDENGSQVAGIFAFIEYTIYLYPFWVLALVWVFISIYDRDRRKLDSKKHDIEIADSVIKGIIPKEGEGIILTPQMQALVDTHTIPDAMKLTEMLTIERVRRIVAASQTEE